MALSNANSSPHNQLRFRQGSGYSLRMKYALVNDTRREAHPDNRRGVCQYCNTETQAKCGRSVVWHWAHKSKASCDPWWENETEWHRNWKNQFPVEWQEIMHVSPTGEKHIADIKTSAGMCIEFQHSNIAYEEQSSRDSFYRNLVWIVDGTANPENVGTFARSKIDRPSGLHPLSYTVKWTSRTELLDRWSFSSKPVLFDFGGPFLWHLRNFSRTSKTGNVVAYSKERFVADCEAAAYFDEFAPMSLDSMKKYLFTKAVTAAKSTGPKRKARF